jgi:hypothetical protein
MRRESRAGHRHRPIRAGVPMYRPTGNRPTTVPLRPKENGPALNRAVNYRAAGSLGDQFRFRHNVGSNTSNSVVRLVNNVDMLDTVM